MSYLALRGEGGCDPGHRQLAVWKRLDIHRRGLVMFASDSVLCTTIAVPCSHRRGSQSHSSTVPSATVLNNSAVSRDVRVSAASRIARLDIQPNSHNISVRQSRLPAWRTLYGRPFPLCPLLSSKTGSLLHAVFYNRCLFILFPVDQPRNGRCHVGFPPNTGHKLEPASLCLRTVHRYHSHT